MTEALDGDLAVYRVCEDETCPAHRPGTSHAHLVRVTRAGTEGGNGEQQAGEPAVDL